MNRHDLATIIRDYLLKNPDVSHVEAKVETKSYTVRVRFWKADGSFVGEVLRLLACLALVYGVAGCGIIVGIDEYSVGTDAGDVVSEDAAVDVRGIEPHIDAAADDVSVDAAVDVFDSAADAPLYADAASDVMPDATPDASSDVAADSCTPVAPYSFSCFGTELNAPSHYCNSWGGSPTPPPCQTCVETFNCACLVAVGVMCAPDAGAFHCSDTGGFPTVTCG